MANIKNKNYRKIDCRLIHDTYMDFMISKDEVISNVLSKNLIATKLNFNNKSNKQVISEIEWVDAISSDKILENIGYTGVDNGFFSYKRDRISNEEFLEIYKNSKFDLSTYKNKFFVTEVNGNTNTLVYPLEKKDEYTSFKGGFYQGFFKIEGDKYQTLPFLIKNEWNFYFTLRKKNYETPSNILNKRHPDNEGIFFFIGTRAENKFWELYNSDIKESESEKYKTNDSNDYFLDYKINNSDVTKHQYFEDVIDICKNEETFLTDGYLQEQIKLSNIELKDNKGNFINEHGFYEIETDNKFITFNNTKNGFTTKTWDDNFKFILTGQTNHKNINYFPYLNHTKDGFNIKNIEDIQKKYQYNYNIHKDIENNAFALKINKDGSIGYKYLIKDCTFENGYTIIEEQSIPNLIVDDKWNNIQLKIVKKTNNTSEECDNKYKPTKMQLFIYINGKLKFISKELPELFLKPLNDNPERQEGVPYNISIGGGSQGLSERVLLDYYNDTNYTLPIEEFFGGTFIGDIKEFIFVPYKLNYPI